MIEVKLNHSNENPFYGLRNCLNLFNSLNGNINTKLLDDCYNEVKDNIEKKQLFFSLLFAVGDVTNRHHNIYRDVKIDNGGNANREAFWNIFLWMKEKHYDQFIRFLYNGLFNEYACFDLLFRSRIQTKGSKVVKVYDIFNDEQYCKDLLTYIYRVINGPNTFNKHLVAKFLTLPRLSKRSKHKKMLPETKQVMEHKTMFLIELSKLMGWEYKVEGTYVNFKGYRQWRQAYNQELESVLFSTKEIFNLDKEFFLKWFDALPAQARFRVKNRILYSNKITEVNGIKFDEPKYPGLVRWYHEWKTFKEEKQKEQRILEEKVRQGQADEADKIKLEKVKKEAKVNVGATNFNDLYNDICRGVIDKLKLESFMNKVNLPYNSLVIIDDSGSMQGAPFNFASFIASVCLCKNPDDDARNLLGFFASLSHWHSYIDKTSDSRNSILRTQIANTKKTPFVDPTLSFYENYQNIDKFCRAVFKSGGTDLTSVLRGLEVEIKKNPEILDALKNYPVWTIISDGDLNHYGSPEASFNDFFRRSENLLGYKPYVVLIDIARNEYDKKYLEGNITRLQGIDNLMYIPSNPAMIEQFLTNFKDMEIFDVYTPLLSIFRSNRYELVRKNTI